MEFCFRKLCQKNALVIAEEWKYEGEYAFYDMTADPEDYAEFVSEELRDRNDFYEAEAGGKLAGFFCVTKNGSSAEIGLGMRPNLCGRGLGRSFLTQILVFLGKHYRFTKLKLNVAAFNRRAIRVYRACGFTVTRAYLQNTNGGSYEFLDMTRETGNIE